MDFQEPKTDMKPMKCYQRGLASKPLSNYYKFFKIFSFEIYNTQWFWHLYACLVKKLVKTKHFKFKYLGKNIVIG